MEIIVEKSKRPPTPGLQLLVVETLTPVEGKPNKFQVEFSMPKSEAKFSRVYSSPVKVDSAEARELEILTGQAIGESIKLDSVNGRKVIGLVTVKNGPGGKPVAVLTSLVNAEEFGKTLGELIPQLKQ